MSELLTKPADRPSGTAPRSGGEPPRLPLAPLPPEDEDEPSFWKRLRWPLAVVVLAGGAWLASTFSSGPQTAPVKKSAIKTVTIQATPPPPPPPPPPTPPPKLQPPPPQEQKMIEQAPVNEPEPKPDEPKPADDPPPALGTNIQGDGPADGFGLSGSRNGGGAGTGRGLVGTGRSASRWGWYAGKVQGTIGETLRRDPRTREAVLNSKIRIWPDASGRISRVRLDSSTGDAALDSAIVAALTGVRLSEPPPADMPAPILLQLSARRP